MGNVTEPELTARQRPLDIAQETVGLVGDGLLTSSGTLEALFDKITVPPGHQAYGGVEQPSAGSLTTVILSTSEKVFFLPADAITATA